MINIRLQARTLARRVDALSLRERAILFVSAVALLAGVADALVLSPQFAQQKAMAQRMRQQNAELAALRQRVAQAAAPVSADDSPRGRVLSALLLVREEQAGLTRQLDALSSTPTPTPTPALTSGPTSTPMPAGAAAQPDLQTLLQRVLRRHAGLTLLQLSTVDDGTSIDSNASASANANTSPRPGGQGGTEPPAAARALELKLQGSYADLQRYLSEIERAVPGQRWSTWQLAAREGVPVLTLRLKLAGDPR